MTGVFNRRLAGACSWWSNNCQRGFVRGRQGLMNILDMDTYARIAHMLADPKLAIPLMICFFNFAAAFPSIAHAWLFLCLEYAGFPDYIITFSGRYTKIIRDISMWMGQFFL